MINLPDNIKLSELINSPVLMMIGNVVHNSAFIHKILIYRTIMNRDVRSGEAGEAVPHL